MDSGERALGFEALGESETEKQKIKIIRIIIINVKSAAKDEKESSK